MTTDYFIIFLIFCLLGLLFTNLGIFISLSSKYVTVGKQRHGILDKISLGFSFEISVHMAYLSIIIEGLIQYGNGEWGCGSIIEVEVEKVNNFKNALFFVYKYVILLKQSISGK